MKKPLQNKTAVGSAATASASPGAGNGSAKARRSSLRPVSLALQGGGTHGAFTWGVLDEILRDGRLDIRAISATSAGAMNAVVMAEGLLDGGPDAARKQLEAFWRSMSVDGRFGDGQRGLLHPLLNVWGAGHPFGNAVIDFMTLAASPYALNPLNLNPLRDFLDEFIDFEKLRAKSPIHLFISATDVFTGRPRIFNSPELTADMVVASTCLPEFFQATIIDGVPYWDGGFGGNPALFPLFDVTETDDIMLVQINPFERHAVPKSPAEIRNRKNEITFNAPLLGELRAIRFVSKLIKDGKLSQADYKHVLMHMVSLHDEVKDLNAASKLDSSWGFLTSLRDAGIRGTRKWLEKNLAELGKVSTFDIWRDTSAPEGQMPPSDGEALRK